MLHMAPVAKDPLTHADAEYAKHMEQASRYMADIIGFYRRGVRIQTPTGLARWGTLIPSYVHQPEIDGPDLIAEENARIAALRVDRDPCFRCGARADIGCNHRRTV